MPNPQNPYVPTRQDIENEEKDSAYWAKKEVSAKEFRNVQRDIESLSKNIVLQEKQLVDLQMTKLKYEGKEAENLQKHIKGREYLMVESKLDLSRRRVRLNHMKDSLSVMDKLKLSAGALNTFDYSKLLKSFTDRMYWGQLIEETVGKIGAELTIIGKIAVQVGKVFQSWDSVTTDLRKTFGGYRTDFKSFSEFVSATVSGHRTYFNQTLDFVVSLSKEFAHLGVNMSVVGSAITGMVDSLGSSLFLSRDLVKQASLLQASFGIAAGTTSAFLLNMSALNGATMESNLNLTGIAQSMAQTAGVPLAEIMGDVAHASAQSYTFLSRNPIAVLKTVTALRTMGSSLEQAVQSSSSILDFTNSINAEMEASVLLGRSINLQRARELAYRRDTVGEQKELTRILQSVDFANRDRFAQEATARAMGLTVDGAMKLLSTQQQLNHARRDPALQQQVKAYDELMKSTDAQLKASGKNNQKLLETLSNQTRMASISDKFSRIMTKLGAVFLPFIDVTLGFIADHLDGILAVAGGLYGAFKVISWTGAKIGTTITGWGDMLTTIAKSGGRFSAILLRAGEITQSIGLKLLKWTTYVKAAGTWTAKLRGWFVSLVELLPGIGKFLVRLSSGMGSLGGGIFNFIKGIASKLSFILLPIMFAYNMFLRIKGLLNDPVLMGTQGFFAFNGKLILRALGVVFGGLYDLANDLSFNLVQKIVNGFIWAGKGIWEAVKGWSAAIWLGLKDFLGFSPSTLGLSIVNGISSIGGMLLNAITAPFTSAWSFVSGFGTAAMRMFDPLFFIGDNILKGIVSAGPAMFSALISPFRMLMDWIAKVPVLGGLMSKMGMSPELPSKNIETKATAAYIPAVTVTPTGTKVAGMEKKAPGEKPAAEEKGATLDDVVKGNSEIIGLLKSILAKDSNVHMDGQLLSTQLARQTEFRGGYGVNKVA